MGTVGEREPLLCRAREVLSQIEAVAPGLLVLELAGHVRRHVDFPHERDRVERVGHRLVVGRVFFDLLVQVIRLAVEGLVGLARFVAFFDPLLRPRLATGGRFGVLLALFGPRDGEAVVEDAAGVKRRRRRVDRRHRRDRREAGRVQLRREQLADRSVGDAEHPDFVTEDPGLFSDRFDHVIAIGVLQRFEEVVGAARAAGSSHVHVDDGEAHQVGEHRDAVFGAGRVGISVAGVLDQRRIRRYMAHRRRECRKFEQPARARLTCGFGRRVDVDRQLDAVPRRQVLVSAVGDFLVVGFGIPWRRFLGVVAMNLQLARLFAAGGQLNPVAASRFHVPEQQAAFGVRVLGVHNVAALQQRRLSIRGQASRIHLVHAPLRGEGGRACNRHQADSERQKRADDASARVTSRRRSGHPAPTLSRTAHDPTISAHSTGKQHVSPRPARTRTSSVPLRVPRCPVPGTSWNARDHLPTRARSKRDRPLRGAGGNFDQLRAARARSPAILQS